MGWGMVICHKGFWPSVKLLYLGVCESTGGRGRQGLIVMEAATVSLLFGLFARGRACARVYVHAHVCAYASQKEWVSHLPGSCGL